MPDKQKKDKDGFDIDSVIDNATLEELRKKYADADDTDTGNSPSPAQESHSTQPNPPTSGEKNSDMLDKEPLTGVHDEVVVQDVFEQETEDFSAENVEELISSFRVIDIESLDKLISSFQTDDEENEKPTLILPGEAVNELSSSLDATPIPIQTQVNNPIKKKEKTRDFLAGMRIVYEDPEDNFLLGNKKTKPVTEQLSFSAEISQQDTPVESLFESTESTGVLAELFEHAQEQPSVKESASKRLAKRIFPHKGDGIGEIIRKTVLNIAVLTMLVCGGILLNIYVVSPYLNSREAQKTVGIKTNSNLFAGWSTAKDKYPETDFPAGMQLRFAELFVTNKDFVGWLTLPGTEIDLPVVQGKNNAEYLKKSFYGEKSKYGCCFVDSNNDVAKFDRNTVIYGHNMQSDDLMLGPLEKFKSIDGFKAAPLIAFSTLYKDTKWKIYAVFISNGAGNGDNGYIFNYIFRNLSSDGAFSDYINQIDERKLYTTGVDILPGDKVLTLSTCVYDFKDARLAVVARMVREGESEDVDVSQATPRKSPRYPQAWYTAKGQTNPYKNAEQWSPN